MAISIQTVQFSFFLISNHSTLLSIISINLIFHFFGRFASLTHLNLSASNFHGEIPSQISHLTKLASLDLSHNYGLKWKEGPWKRLLQNATDLKELVLDDTDMSSISINILNLSSSLVILSLQRTQLRENLTYGIFCLPNLTFLDLSHNSLVDSIPSSLLTLPRLSFLNINCNNLSGEIPNVFPQSNKFRELDFSVNNLGGELPSTLSNLQHLTLLYLSRNKFSGQIPDVF
ncbi:hypothetical protein V8G54_011921, partial [Vigna mungo]